MKDYDTINYKIGITSNIKKRIKQLQTGNSNRLQLVCYIKNDNVYNLEKELHNHFKDKLVFGEWYNLNLDDIEYINNLEL